MPDEKLPEYLQAALDAADIYGDDAHGVVTPRHSIVAAIHRFAREREAAALERAAKLPDLRWPHIVSPCACCEDLRQQWKALAEPGKGGAT